MSNPETLENFERAFRGGVNGCRRTCECGVVYWDAWNKGYDWDEGEVEGLEANPGAKGVDHAIGTVEFEGRIYVDACTCWHDRAQRIIGWLNAHAKEIAAYLSHEKSRKQAEADASPVVEAVR